MRPLGAAPEGNSVPKILIADDNTKIQKMVALAFEERGIEVVSVGNGEAAVRRIPDLKPDLVLADIFMPVRNGYEVCEFIKKHKDLSHVPVILLVGAFDPLDEKEARRVGADGILKKPFIPPDPLIAMVISTLEKNPKIAAELAKAKETVPEPPIPAAAIEMPARKEPQPLPEFPEPDAEEAAVAYGFGAGKRSLEELETAGEASPPVADLDEEEGEEEFDASATARDWRRAALDFEIPEEDSKRSSYVPDEGPAEEQPSEHAGIAEPVNVAGSGEEKEAAPSAAPVEGIAPDQAPESAPTPESAPAPEPTPTLEATPAATASSPETDSLADEIGLELGEVPQAELQAPAEPEPASAPAPADEATAATELPAPHEEYAEGGWFQNASAPQVESEEAPSSNALSIVPSEENSSPAQETAEAAEPAPVEADEEPFFADETEAGEPAVAASAPAPVFEKPPKTFSEIVAATSDFVPESPEVQAEGEEAFAAKDPDLFESPVVNPVPEPLLVGEESDAPSNYGAPEEETAPPHAYLSSAPSKIAAEEPSAEAGANISPAPAADAHPAEAAEVPAPNGAAVDAIVQKLLEKIGPQLQEVLSEGVLKPLVEDLVQQELTKKEH